MADIEGSSSDSDDQEYIPEGELPSSGSDVSEGVPEELEGRGRGGGRKRGKRGRKQLCHTRRRRGGIHLEGGGGHGEESDDSDHSGDVGVEGEEEEEERRKARVDDLWASFKQNTVAETRTTTVTKAGGAPLKPPTSNTVTIKETYDFAGEEVIVEKKVAADSKEALQFLRSQSGQSEERKTPRGGGGERAHGGVLSAAVAGGSGAGSSVVSPAAKPAVAGTKRMSSLSSIFQSLTKKPKMSTLEKSRLDWMSYKKDEGLEEELQQHNKDGYLERQEFLQRTDLRQFELEREERLKRFRRLK